MDCRLVSISYWNTQISPQVMMFFINSGSSSNLSRKSEQIFWWWNFRYGSDSLRPTSYWLASCSVRHVKFFWQFLYRRLQSQWSSEWSYDDLHAQFHWFWSLFAELKQRQVNLAVDHLHCSLCLQKTVYIIRKHTPTRQKILTIGLFQRLIALNRSFFLI